VSWIIFHDVAGLFVVVSWISFVVPPDVIPGRMALLITLFLVLGKFPDCKTSEQGARLILDAQKSGIHHITNRWNGAGLILNQNKEHSKIFPPEAWILIKTPPIEVGICQIISKRQLTEVGSDQI
jgi:hypothetical protein